MSKTETIQGITKEQFHRYEAVRQSGVTNMFAVSTVMSISGLTKEQCFTIMKGDNYSKMADEFGTEV